VSCVVDTAGGGVVVSVAMAGSQWYEFRFPELMVVMMVKVMRRDVYPYMLGGRKRDDKAFWIKEPFTELEERILDPSYVKKWPRGYDEDWYLCRHEGTPEALRWLYSFGGATRLTFGGGAPHRPNSLDPAQPALAPDRRRQKPGKEPAP
jgi:hypothetical protein